jgi:TonB family protein
MKATYRSSDRRSSASAQAEWAPRAAAIGPVALWLLIALTLMLMSVPRLAAQDLLASARSLYESAAYDEALTTLQRLASDRAGMPTRTLRAVEEYRFLCLSALGRTAEARDSMAAAIAAEPLYKPDASATSPRIMSTFQEVRRDVLPGLIGELYAEAKNAYERKDHKGAESGFRTVLTLIEDPDMQGKQADLGTLARGFLDLTTAAIKAAEAPAPAPAAAATKAATPAATSTPAPVRAAIITPPVALRQVVPPMPPDIARFGQMRIGILEITIDETGKVESASFTQGIHPVYDNQVLTAARAWRYQPAMSEGVPVKFRKTIKVSMATSPQE